MIKIALIEEDTLLCERIALLINSLQRFEVVIKAASGADLIERIPGNSLPDIVLVDMMMPLINGVETARWLHQFHPHVRVMAISMIKSELLVIRMLHKADPVELRNALLQVYRDGYHYNQLVTPEMKRRAATRILRPDFPLNEQEFIFLQWTCTEKSHKQIATEMCVSPRTVDGYRDALFRKFRVSTRVGIVLYALRNGIIQL